MIRFFLLAFSVTSLLACSHSSSGGGSKGTTGTDPEAGPDAQIDPLSQTFKQGYQLIYMGCDTGVQNFGSDVSEEDLQTKYCEGLQDDQRNNSCAEPLRKDFFEKKCPGMTWTPRYKANKPAATIPAGPNYETYRAAEDVRSFLKFQVVDELAMAATLTGKEQKAFAKFADDLMSCGLSYVGPKCLDSETVNANVGDSLVLVDGKYIFYSEVKLKGSTGSVALVFKVDQLQPTIKISKLEISGILKPRTAGQSLENYLSDKTNLSPLILVTLADDIQAALIKRLEHPRNLRELYHVSRAFLEINMTGTRYQAAKKTVVNAVLKNKALITSTEDTQYQNPTDTQYQKSIDNQYQEAMLSFITSQVDLKQEDLVDLCKHLLNSKSEAVKQVAATIVLSSQPSRADLKPLVVKALKNPQWDIRQKAIAALSKTQKTFAEENQLLLMIDDSVDVVSETAMGVDKTMVVSEKHLDTIKKLITSSNWTVRMEAAKLLGRVNSPDSVKTLIALMDDGVNVVQDEVVKQLNQKPLADTSVDDLTGKVKSSDWTVRKSAVLLLSKINTDNANTALISYVDDAVDVVQELAFNKLNSKTLKSAHLPLLVKTYDSSNWVVRKDISILIGKLSGLAATTALIEHMDDSVDVVQEAIVTQLSGRPLTDASVPMLVKNFKSSDWTVRKSTAKLLGKIKTSSSRNALENQLPEEPVDVVKEQIIASIKVVRN